ncbi:MAG: DNA/RNA non-specific endonuclease [Paludibacteraceae bacterium]|nr:DNA/RNA non-specific endonuclease [Paludibacteraceae bacterium]
MEKPKENQSRAVANSVGQKKSSGNGVGFVNKQENALQRQTVIDGIPNYYKYNQNTLQETAGEKAWAYLDPNNPVNGSEPGNSELYGSMNDLKKQGYNSMIKGHLINSQLGGPGGSENLFPITTQANNLHKLYAENKIKQEVTNRNGTNNGVYYSVEATKTTRSTEFPSAAFTCEAYEWDVSKGANLGAVNTNKPILKQLDIESKPEKGTTGSGSVVPILTGKNAFKKKFKYKQNKPMSINYPNRKLGKGWGEVGSGKGRGSRNWNHLGKGMKDGAYLRKHYCVRKDSHCLHKRPHNLDSPYCRRINRNSK